MANDDEMMVNNWMGGHFMVEQCNLMVNGGHERMVGDGKMMVKQWLTIVIK